MSARPILSKPAQSGVISLARGEACRLRGFLKQSRVGREHGPHYGSYPPFTPTAERCVLTFTTRRIAVARVRRATVCISTRTYAHASCRSIINIIAVARDEEGLGRRLSLRSCPARPPLPSPYKEKIPRRGNQRFYT